MLTEYRRFLLAGEQAGSRYAMGRPRRAPVGQAGMQIGNRAGSSLEFRDHREYQPGDDLRRIDWNAFGRSDKLIVKLYQEEVSPHLDVVLDGSHSMALGNSAKAQASLGLCAILATAATNSGYTCCGWLAGKMLKRLESGNERPSRWQGINFDFHEQIADALLNSPGCWHRPGIRVLISDLLWPGDPWGILSRFADRSTSIVVVQILAREDVHPPKRGSVRLADCETGEVQEIFLDAIALQRYQDALTRHQQNWHRACRQIGATMTTVIAEEVVSDWRLQSLLDSGILTAAV